MSAPIQPGAVLGVLGGGQLGRMFALAARQMGYHVDVFAPDSDSPTQHVARRGVQAPYDDLDALERFARDVDVITFEFENIPVETVEAAARYAPVRPGGSLLHATQDRMREKRALMDLGLPVARYGTIESEADLATAAAASGFPAVLKTAAWGYDGKGQARVANAEELLSAWKGLGSCRAVLEALVPFLSEISVVGARTLDGQVGLFDPFLNHHANHILDVTLFPAGISAATLAEAQRIARAVLEGFDVCGVLCVEMFLLEGGSLLVNEIAPRTHNSGHVTIDSHVTSQFEQQVRAVCGLPLGSTEAIAPAGAMANLLGELWEPGCPAWSAALSDPGVRLHLYGKDEPRRGRKMGHLSLTAGSVEAAERRVRAARAALSRR